MGKTQGSLFYTVKPVGARPRMLRICARMMVALLAVCFSIAQSVALAADESEDVINYAYSNRIGSGFYKVGDRSVYLLRGPFSWTLREADSKKWGLELLFPATIGFQDFSHGQNNVATITFVPGVQISYPILENWWLKPFGQFGVGRDFAGSDIAWIYGAGIKSLTTFELEDSQLDFGAALTKAGQNQAGGGSDSGIFHRSW